MRKATLALTLILGIHNVMAPASAFAHGEITKSSPIANSIMPSAPTSIVMKFDGNLIVLADKKSNFLSLLNSAGGEVKLSQTSVKGSVISAKILQKLTAGRYKVNWRIVSEDGHPVKGSYFFTVSSKAKS